MFGSVLAGHGSVSSTGSVSSGARLQEEPPPPRPPGETDDAQWLGYPHHAAVLQQRLTHLQKDTPDLGDLTTTAFWRTVATQQREGQVSFRAAAHRAAQDKPVRTKRGKAAPCCNHEARCRRCHTPPSSRPAAQHAHHHAPRPAVLSLPLKGLEREMRCTTAGAAAAASPP